LKPLFQRYDSKAIKLLLLSSYSGFINKKSIKFKNRHLLSQNQFNSFKIKILRI
jgi:hypothetical protein